jgi:hypothetical protein
MSRYIEILDEYFKLNDKFGYQFNTPSARKFMSEELKLRLPFLDRVICDETNNPPWVTDMGDMVATVIYNKRGYECDMLDLVFGYNVDFYHKLYTRYKKLEKIQKIMNL